MISRLFWTHHRFTGLTLILGCCLFLGAAGLMPKDIRGNFLVNLPLREQLLLISTHTSQLQWSFSLFISGVIVTFLGFAMLTMLFREAGERFCSHLALLTSLFGAVLMVIYIAFPLGVEPVVAQELGRTGVIPNYYVPLASWAQVLFVIFTILAFSTLAAYGGAVLSTRVLPHWVGWLALVYGLAGLVFVGFAAGNVPPFLHYLMPIVMGILLLLRRYQAPTVSH